MALWAIAAGESPSGRFTSRRMREWPSGPLPRVNRPLGDSPDAAPARVAAGRPDGLLLGVLLLVQAPLQCCVACLCAASSRRAARTGGREGGRERRGKPEGSRKPALVTFLSSV